MVVAADVYPPRLGVLEEVAMGTMDVCAAVVEGMVPSERGEAGAMGRIWLIGRLSDFDVDVAEVGRHVEVVTAGDSG